MKKVECRPTDLSVFANKIPTIPRVSRGRICNLASSRKQILNSSNFCLATTHRSDSQNIAFSVLAFHRFSQRLFCISFSAFLVLDFGSELGEYIPPIYAQVFQLSFILRASLACVSLVSTAFSSIC